MGVGTLSFSQIQLPQLGMFPVTGRMTIVLSLLAVGLVVSQPTVQMGLVVLVVVPTLNSTTSQHSIQAIPFPIKLVQVAQSVLPVGTLGL
jgi:hypothetical protein